MATGSRLARDVDELNASVLHRLENLQDHIEGYRRGRRGRVKSIASELRVLVVSSGRNNQILFKIASLHGVDLVVKRDVPPVPGLKAELPLDEVLGEAKFQSGVPEYLMRTGYEIIKAYADQQGSHEDMSITEDLYRLRSGGLSVGGIPAIEAILVDLAETVLLAAKPLEEKLRNG